MKKIFFLLTTTLLMVACQESNLDVVAPEGLTPGDVYASLDVSTKTSLGEGNVVNWVTNDSISVFAANTYNYRYKLKNGNGTTSGKFEYDGYTGTGSDIANHYAVYPYSAKNSVNTEGELTVTLPSEFNAEDGVAKAVMVSKSTTANTFAFKNAQGLIRLRLTAANNLPPTFNKVKKVQVTSATAKLVGPATVTFDGDGIPSVTLPSLGAEKDTVTIDFGTGITLSSNATDVYFPLAAGSYTDIELIFTMDGNKIRKFNLDSFDQTINKIYTLSHEFIMADVDASTQGYENVAPSTEFAEELLETENSVEVSKMAADETLTIPEAQASKEVNIKIDAVDGNGPVTIKAGDSEQTAPATLTVEAPANAKVIVDCPATHVELIGTNVTYDEVTASTSDNTLVVGKGVTVTSLVVKKGNVEVQGTVTTVTRDEANHDATTKVFLNGGSLTIAPTSPIEVLNKDFKIGDVFYYTLADAIDAVEDNGIITVLNDISNTHGISVPSGKNFTVDFAGHSYAMECPGAGSAGTQTIGFQLLQNSTITFKNGTISCTAANKDKTWNKTDATKGIAMMIQNYANLTLEDMTINATNIAHNGVATRYAISNNSGDVKFTGNTIITTNEGDYAFDVCKYASYDAPTVTWNSTGTVKGIIELSGGNFVVASNLKVTTPIRANSGSSTMTINEGVVVSPVDAGFGTAVKTRFAETSNETQKGVVVVNRGGDLKITGQGTIDAKGKCFAAITLTEKGEANTGDVAKLTVQGASSSKYIKLQGGQYYAISGNGTRGNTDVTVKYAQLDAPNGFCIYQPQQGTLTISSGTFNGYSCVGVKSGNVTISGGTFTASGAKKNYVTNGSGIEETGQALIIDNCDYPGGSPVVDIKGGTFISENNTAIGNYYGGSQTAAITKFIHGGTYSSPAEEAWVGDDMYWELTDGSVYKYNKALTFESGTYKLLGDKSLTRLSVGTVTKMNLSVIVDLGGHTLTLTPQTATDFGLINHQSSKNNNVTIKNGTLDVKAGKCAIAMQKDCNNVFNLDASLTINTAVGGVLVEGNNTLNCAATISNTGNCAAIQTNGGNSANSTINITGGSISSSEVGIYHPAGNLNILGGAITGTTGVYVKSGTTIISGGTITGNGEKKDYQYDGSGCYATGDALVVDNCDYPGGAPSVTLTNTVTAATLVSTKASQIGNYYGKDQTAAVSITNNSGVSFITRTNGN